LRYTTERIEAITAGTAKLVGTNSEEILATTSYLLQNHEAYTKMATKINPFGNGQAAKLIREVIEDYLQQSA
jgi:UDP-N-acetylglucosamine 2-epimerase (non-hydrolysing)